MATVFTATYLNIPYGIFYNQRIGNLLQACFSKLLFYGIAANTSDAGTIRLGLNNLGERSQLKTSQK